MANDMGVEILKSDENSEIQSLKIIMIVSAANRRCNARDHIPHPVCGIPA
jgi:hypothetical protein